MSIGAFGVAAGRRETRYGWIVWVLTSLGFFLIYVITLFQCQAIINGEGHGEFHLDINKPNNQPTVTASPGFISISTEILDNSNTAQVVSHSTVPVDTVVKAEDGRDLFTNYGLMPGESFYFEHEELCTVTASAS